jgi:YidC/Oxa1 family membrane protein insertase
MELRIFTGKDAKPVSIDPGQLRHENWTLVQSTNDQATYEWTIYRAVKGQTAKKMLSLLKTYKVTKGSYSIEMSLKLVNHSKQQLRIEIDQAGPVGLDRVGYRSDERTAVEGKLIEGNIQPVLRGTKDLTKAEYGKAKLIGKSSSTNEPLLWFGLANKYFASMVYLLPMKTDRLNAAGLPTEFFIKPLQATDADRMWLPTMKTGPLTLAPASEKTLKFDLFVGPKERTLLKNTPLYAKLRYVDVISSGSCSFCTFDWLMVGLMWLLNFFANNLFFGNFGLAIMLLVLIVRLVLHPLTKKGQVAMAEMQKKMAAMQPQIQQIKKKYANDKSAMNAEMAKLYKTHGNPMTNMLGCLPMLLQMPIWIALYSGLRTSVELRHAAFLPVWITDLAAPDQLFTWTGDLPLIGHAFNLLPILLTVAMFLQQKLTPHPNKAATSPEQGQQQKMMMFMMPIMMLFFFYNAPSGLTLYIMASTTIGVIEQQRIRAHIRQKEAQAAAESQFIDVPGKGPRDSRPKKPKGPLWTKRG